MLSFDGLVAVCVLYAAALFGVAFWAEKQAAQGRGRWINSPLVYTLSLSIFTTAWTFYGAVGSAARSGLEYLTVYLGPTLIFVGWFWLLRKLVRIGRAQRITSIADMISSRYGKSPGLAAAVTILMVIGVTPYIALQLQSVTLSFGVYARQEALAELAPERTAIWVAGGLALFTIIFGTRSIGVSERHPGVVSAIALEAVVKLLALVAVGIYVVWRLADGPADIMARIDASPISDWSSSGARWVGLTALSGMALLALPRMFHVMVVENSDERHLATASWAFPLYLLAMSLFVIPIAVVGLEIMPAGSDSDYFVLTLPLSQGADGTALLAFLGGFSSATSMVMVAALALATMVSNHIVVPLALRATAGETPHSGDMRRVGIRARRLAILGILALGFGYYRVSGGTEALASIGYTSFLGVSQIMPALLGGILWRGATRMGAFAGIGTGFAIWAWMLLLPHAAGGWIDAGVLTEGPWGIAWLSPATPFGLLAGDPLITAMILSLGLNLLAFIAVSLATFPSPVERLQGAQFVDIYEHSHVPGGWRMGDAATDDLLVMARRVLGTERSARLFEDAAQRQGLGNGLPRPTPDFIERVEREMAGYVGAATAHAMVEQITGGTTIRVEDLLAVADETAEMMEYQGELEAKSHELTRTAARLREANAKLTALSRQKDAFLSQISHELRTPMTSIRAFSEILMASPGLDIDERRRFSRIIHDESLRLTRLLDDLLDLSVLENGHVSLSVERVRLARVIDRAVTATSAGDMRRIRILRDRDREEVELLTDPDRLAQVFINLISNAQKYCDAEDPELTIGVQPVPGGIEIDFTDNGSGVPTDQRATIFEKFARLDANHAAGGAGLGLAISREIVNRLDGALSYVPVRGGGATFRVRMPQREAAAA